MFGRTMLVLACLTGPVLATGCGRAADRVTTDAQVTTVDSTFSATTVPAATTTTRRPPSTTAATVAPTTVAPATVAPVTVAPSPRPPVATTPSPAAGTGPRVLAVACARHPDDGGDWVVFTLSSPATTVAAAFGVAAVGGTAVAGDATLLVTLTPAVDATGGRFSFGSTCDHVAEVASVARPDGSLVWVIGTKGLPRLLNTPTPASSQGGWALVVKLGS
jgi:hypothetical protein